MPTTIGLWQNRGSASASRTMNGFSDSNACVQNEAERVVSVTSMFWLDLNHCLSRSTNEIADIGALRSVRASQEIPSNAWSAGVSNISYECSAARRSASFGHGG